MFVLPDLPYGYDALAPVISERTMRFHHDKHHGAYVTTTNELVAAAKTSPDSLEGVIREARSAGETKLFNNAAQAWNHGFFWEAMAPGGEKPGRDLLAAIKEAFGDLGGLKQQFVKNGAEHFGSGWVWLLDDRDRKLKVRATHDAEDMVTNPGQTPLLVCDLWEHAYYLDHQNDRKGFLEAWFDTLPNWTFAAKQLEAAAAGKGAWTYPPPATESKARQASRG